MFDWMLEIVEFWVCHTCQWVLGLLSSILMSLASPNPDFCLLSTQQNLFPGSAWVSLPLLQLRNCLQEENLRPGSAHLICYLSLRDQVLCYLSCLKMAVSCNVPRFSNCRRRKINLDLFIPFWLQVEITSCFQICSFWLVCYCLYISIQYFRSTVGIHICRFQLCRGQHPNPMLFKGQL